MTWVKLPPDENYFVCEYGCFLELPDEERCDHSSDVGEDGRHNVAHWKKVGDSGMPHGFLCNYHYEELVLGINHPQDEPVKSPAEMEWPSAAEFELFMGEVK